MPITHSDGQQYFSQDELERAVKDRLKNAHQQLEELTVKATAAEQLRTQLEEARALAEQAQGGLHRYRAAASHGLVDDDTIEAFEAARVKYTGTTGKQLDFGGYIEAGKADPSILPSYLRNVIGQGGPAPVAPVAPVAPQPEAPPRPAWSPAVSGQAPVQTGARVSFGDRVSQAQTLDDLVKIQQDRNQSRRG